MAENKDLSKDDQPYLRNSIKAVEQKCLSCGHKQNVAVPLDPLSQKTKWRCSECEAEWNILMPHTKQEVSGITFRASLISGTLLDIKAENMVYEDGAFSFWEGNKVFLYLTQQEVRSIIRLDQKHNVTEIQHARPSSQ